VRRIFGGSAHASVAGILVTCAGRRRAASALAAAAVLACADRGPTTPLDFWLHSLGGEFLQLSSYDTTGGNADRLEIPAGDSAVLVDQRGAGVVRRIWITVASRDPDYLRRLALAMSWDDEATPSVAVPLGDFFGNGFDKRHYTAVPMGVSSGGFYSYLPMPFRTHARIVVHNGTGRPVDAFYYQIDLERVRRLPRQVQTLHALWHRDPRTEAPAPHRVLDAHGRGTFVGLSLNAESYDNTLGFLEGDETWVVDGTFRGQGTGTEDYFNSGWYFDQGSYAAPFHGLVVKDERRGRIAAYRWHLPDPVAFRESLRVELEHGHGNTAVADYATVAYWYQVEPHAPAPVLPEPNARRALGVKIPPGAILDPVFADRAGRSVATIPIPRPDCYDVAVYPRGGPGAGRVTLSVGGERAIPVSLAAGELGDVLPSVPLGPWCGSGSVTLVAEGAAPDVLAAADLVPRRAWADAWLVVGPFPNPQRLGTETSPGLDSVYAPERNPRASGYPGVGGQPLSWKAAPAGADGRVHLNPLFVPNDWVLVYAKTCLWSPDGREATLLLGADDAHVLWVNGERVSERQGRHVSEPDELAVPVRLRPGCNAVQLKVADLDGGWAFLLRAADPSGRLVWRRP
jgi:hypothetical protein